MGEASGSVKPADGTVEGREGRATAAAGEELEVNGFPLAMLFPYAMFKLTLPTVGRSFIVSDEIDVEIGWIPLVRLRLIDEPTTRSEESTDEHVLFCSGSIVNSIQKSVCKSHSLPAVCRMKKSQL